MQLWLRLRKKKYLLSAAILISWNIFTWLIPVALQKKRHGQNESRDDFFIWFHFDTHTQEVIRLAVAMLEGKQKRGFLHGNGTEKTPRQLLDSKARFSLFNAIKKHIKHTYTWGNLVIVHHQYFTLIRFHQIVTLCLFYCGSGWSIWVLKLMKSCMCVWGILNIQLFSVVHNRKAKSRFATVA